MGEKCSPWNIRNHWVLRGYDRVSRKGGSFMKIRQQFEKTQKRYLRILQSFLLAATLVSIIGIVFALTPGHFEEAQYLTILSAVLACQGVWGFVLCDCMHRRLGKE